MPSYCQSLMFLITCCLPVSVLAQAGSSDPIIIESQTAFYAGLNIIEAGQAGEALPAMLPRGVLKLPDEEQYMLWVELQQGRMLLLEQQPNGGLIIKKIIPVSIGKNGIGKEEEGDKRTPIGVYRITSFLKDSALTDYYGLGAYPLSYPNAYDRLQNRTGSGIWLHGLPKNVDERPLLDSDGCVVIDNDSLLEMAGYIKTGLTHIVLTKGNIEWQSFSASEKRRLSLEEAFYDWKRAWEQRDNDLYLSYYSDGFYDFNRNKAQWSAYKRRVNNNKTSLQVEVSQLSFIADPERPEMVTIRYYQNYRSNDYNWDGWKEQLWRLTLDKGWQIQYEGNG